MKEMTVRNVVVAFLFTVLGTIPIAADVPAPLLDAYLKVHAGLAGDQLSDAVADAKVVAAEAAKVGDEAANVRAAAEKLAGAQKLDAARDAFGQLSEALIKLAGGKAPSADVKIASCPMVKKSWVQKGDKIQNPYYGKSMLSCGDFKK